MRNHGSTLYLAVGTGEALHVGVTGDPERAFADLHLGRHLPKVLRDRQPVRVVFQMGPFPSQRSEAVGRRLLQGLPAARLRALLAGSRDELASVAGHLAELDLRYRLETDSAGPVQPLDFERDFPLPPPPAGAALTGPTVALEHLQVHVGPRRWRVLLARRQARRTLEDIAREEGCSPERIRQMDVGAWSRGSRFLLRQLGEGWRDLSDLCRKALATWGFVSGCALREEAQRLWETDWSTEDREAWLLLFHLLDHRLASQTIWGVLVYSLERSKLLPRISAFLEARDAAKVPAELLDLHRREWDRLQEACARETGRIRRPALVHASEEAYRALEEGLLDSGPGGAQKWDEALDGAQIYEPNERERIRRALELAEQLLRDFPKPLSWAAVEFQGYQRAERRLPLMVEAPFATSQEHADLEWELAERVLGPVYKSTRVSMPPTIVAPGEEPRPKGPGLLVPSQP